MSLLKQAWLLLTVDQRRHGLIIVLLMFIAMILESLSVGIILPLTSILLTGDLDNSFFANFFVIDLFSERNLIYIALTITIIIFLIKNLALVFNHWRHTKFLRKLQFEITNKFFIYYLKKDYIFFLQNNSAHLYRNLTDIVSSSISYIKGYMILFTEIVVFIGIIIILFYVDFMGTAIILSLVSIVSIIIYVLTIGKISSFGEERNIVGGELNKHLLQAMASAKDVKILDREEDLVYQVNKNLFKMTRLHQIIQFINGLPRFSLEMLMICAFSLLVFMMMAAQREMTEIIQYLSVFAVASFRIVPGISRMLSSFQSIKYLEPSVKILLKEFDSKYHFDDKKNNRIQDSNVSLEFNKEINLSNLSFSYPSRNEFSLSKISMKINKGEFIGIIGQTGSGKSTLMNLLIGLLKPSEGKVEVDKLDINSNLHNWFNKIGYVPQSVYLTDDTIKKNIAFGLKEENINDDLVKKAVEQASLDKFFNNLQNGLNTIVGEKGIRLSGGQQQRIGIARALYREPEILIFDEATSSLDTSTEEKIMDSIQFLKRKKTLIIVTHRLSTIKNCDKVFFIDKGKIVKHGSPKEILGEI